MLQSESVSLMGHLEQRGGTELHHFLRSLLSGDRLVSHSGTILECFLKVWGHNRDHNSDQAAKIIINKSHVLKQ